MNTKQKNRATSERAAAHPDLDAILAPLRTQFASSGVTGGQLIQDITAAQMEYRSESH
jgi:hypothetical protein